MEHLYDVHTQVWWLTQGEHLCGGATAEPEAFIMNLTFTWIRNLKTGYGHSNLGIWQASSHKGMKWTCHKKEGNQQTICGTVIKLEVSCQIWKFRTLSSLSYWQFPNIYKFFIRLMVILMTLCVFIKTKCIKYLEDLDKLVYSYFIMTTTWCFKLMRGEMILSKRKIDQWTLSEQGTKCSWK